MSDVARDAAIAAATYLADHLRGLPADRGRIEAFFAEVVYAAVIAALNEEREQRARRELNPSRN